MSGCLTPAVGVKLRQCLGKALKNRLKFELRQPYLDSGSKDMLTTEQLLAAPEDDYMNADQLAFFKDLLEDELAKLYVQIKEAREQLQTVQYEADELDKATVEEDRRFQLRMIDRLAKLEPKIKASLKLIENGEFGYCEVTGEPIGVRRLLARPTAVLCAEEKQRQEMLEKNYREE